ncbi:hypothetical protein [Paenibacillus periandrae]|uniref:hypothetical protein n=1 Tax=Paenibacillus periandrae TaxID=1761741 RepID=UPI001F099387|nr:hypothetical protein [Paenibacillus periandrae]
MSRVQRPNISSGAHPLEQGQYTLPTLELDRLMKKIIQVIKAGGPGMIVYGRPRLGNIASKAYRPKKS